MIRHAKSPIFVVFLTMLLDKTGETLIFPLLPFILAAYNPDGLTLGLLASVSTFVAVFGGPLAGACSDAIGRRPVVLICIAINLVSLLIFGWAGSLAVIFMSRALGGIGSSTIGTLQAYITDISTPENRAKNLGVSGAAFGLGAIGGPALGGGLVGLGASVPVFVAAGMTGINLVMAVLFLKETLSEENQKKFNIRSVNVFSKISSLLSNQGLRGISLGFAFFNLAFSAFTSMLVLSLKEMYGWEASQTSGIFVVVGLTMTYAQVALIGKLVKRYGERDLFRVGMLVVAAGILCIPAASINDQLVGVIIVGAGILLAVGASLVLPTSRSLVSGLVSKKEQGVQLASLASLAAIASTIGPVMGGWLYDQSTFISFLVEALVCIIGFAIIGKANNKVSEEGQVKA
jgi:MFS family permease